MCLQEKHQCVLIGGEVQVPAARGFSGQTPVVTGSPSQCPQLPQCLQWEKRVSAFLVWLPAMLFPEPWFGERKGRAERSRKRQIFTIFSETPKLNSVCISSFSSTYSFKFSVENFTQEMHPFKVYSSVIFNIATTLCNQHHYLLIIPEYLHHPRRKLYVHCSYWLSFVSSSPWQPLLYTLSTDISL